MSTRARKTWGAGALVALAAAFLALTIVVTFALRGARLDLTASRLYTIAPGTERIVGSLTEPVNLYFFLSDEASRSNPALRAYAQRVRELLEEMAQRSNGKLRLTVIDPQPFSEDEDRATDFGLAAVPVGTNGEPLYFGLAGTNSTDGRETIGFFQPDKEEFLEYDVASLVYRLAHPKKPVVGLLSTLPVDASFDQMTGQMREGWAAIQQTRELFDVRAVARDAKAIDPDIGVLLLVHPKDLPPRNALRDRPVRHAWRQAARVRRSGRRIGAARGPDGRHGRRSWLGPGTAVRSLGHRLRPEAGDR